MRMRWLLCVVLGTLAWGQTPPSAPPSPQAAPGPAQPGAKMPAPADSSASVRPTAPVLTINGVCPAPAGTTAAKTGAAKSAAAKPTSAAKSSADCKTVITKAEFEKLADALSPNVTPQLRRQLAGLLPRIYALSDAAKKQGLDKTPEFAESVKFVRMQVLSERTAAQDSKRGGRRSSIGN